MTAARHDRIVILSRMTRMYPSAVRNEKWPCLNVSGTLRHAKRLSAGTPLSPQSESRDALSRLHAECRSMISRFMFRNDKCPLDARLSVRGKHDISCSRALISDADHRMKRYLFIINFVASDSIGILLFFS